MERRKIICVTPVKNEAWILKIFLECVSVWADHIIIADQNSTDGSVEIARRFEKVILIENKNSEYNENTRQKLLINEARKIPGTNNVFFALDADEILVNFSNNPEWQKILNAQPGTPVWFPWLNVLPGNDTFYQASPASVFAFIDDGRDHKGVEMHSLRLPHDRDYPMLICKDIYLLHFQYAVRERMLSKHRWYESLEKIKYPSKSNIEIYRVYHHIDLPIKGIQPIVEEWLMAYTKTEIDIKNVKDDGLHWWDKEVCVMFDDYGVEKFKRQAIWYKNWKSIYASYFSGKDSSHIYDPRNLFDKWVHRWLKRSQSNRFSIHNRVIERILRMINW